MISGPISSDIASLKSFLEVKGSNLISERVDSMLERAI